MNCHIKVCMKVHVRVRMELHIDVYMEAHINFTWKLAEALKLTWKIIEVLLSVHLYQLKIWKFTSKFAVNFTAEIAQNTAFKAHVCTLYGLEITLHQNLHKSSHWKLKLVYRLHCCLQVTSSIVILTQISFIVEGIIIMTLILLIFMASEHHTYWANTWPRDQQTRIPIYSW